MGRIPFTQHTVHFACNSPLPKTNGNHHAKISIIVNNCRTEDIAVVMAQKLMSEHFGITVTLWAKDAKDDGWYTEYVETTTSYGH